MRKYVAILSLSVLALNLSACSTLGLGGSSSETTDANAGMAGDINGQDLNAIQEQRFALGSIPTPDAGGPLRDVNFDYDSSIIGDVARQNLDYNVEVLRSNPALKVQIEGHCDERGTVEYNMALGETRARAVRDALIALGISAQRLTTVSYGEEVPLDTGHGEESWARNRRAHLATYTDQRQ